MSRAYTGKDLEVFWGREASWKNGIDGGDHQAFNPMEKVAIPKPTFSNVSVKTAERLENAITYTELMTPGEKELELIWRDPFLMLTMFGHKTCSYTTGTGTIGADFTLDDDKESIWMHFHIQDQKVAANHIDRTLKGGEIVSYGWSAEKGGVLREKATIKFADIDLAPGSIPMNEATDFQNQAFSATGGWASYDSNIPQAVHSTSLSITFDGAGALAGIKIESLEFLATLSKEYEHTLESRVASMHWESARDFEVTLVGYLDSLEEYEEVELAFEDKTPGTLIIYYDTTAGNEKYIQLTNMFLDTIDDYDIPSASEPVKLSLKLTGGAGVRLSYSGIFAEGVTPCDQITT